MPAQNSFIVVNNTMYVGLQNVTLLFAVLHGQTDNRALLQCKIDISTGHTPFTILMQNLVCGFGKRLWMNFPTRSHFHFFITEIWIIHIPQD